MLFCFVLKLPRWKKEGYNTEKRRAVYGKKKDIWKKEGPYMEKRRIYGKKKDRIWKKEVYRFIYLFIKGMGIGIEGMRIGVEGILLLFDTSYLEVMLRLYFACL
jgi:hypothetical protein